MKTQLLLLAFAAVAMSGRAQSQSDTITSATADQMHRDALTQSTHVISTGHTDLTTAERKDSVQRLLNLFYLDQYRQFHDPEAPYFMFMTRDASFALGVGGMVMLRGWFDWNGSQDSYEFHPYNIAIPPNPAERHGLGASLSQTSVFFTLLGHKNNLAYKVFVQIAAKNKDILLKKAYVTLNDFTIGLTSSTFEDGAALVPSVDAEGPNGQISKTSVVGRYIHNFKSGWTVGGAVEFPSSSQNTVEGETESCRDYVPDLIGLVQYGWNGGSSHVRLSGLLRNMSYRNLLAQRNHNVIGWGAQLSGVVNVVNPLTIYFSGAIGQGIGSYVGDLSEGAYDLVVEDGAPGKMVAPYNLGITAGVRYDFTRNLFACVGFGETRNIERHGLAPDDYEYGLYGNVNLFWRITHRFLAGVEYIVGRRENFDGSHAPANRIDAMLSFSF